MIWLLAVPPVALLGCKIKKAQLFDFCRKKLGLNF